MKKIVWANKSNGQLCVTIPKNSGVKEGDIVNVTKEKIRKIAYSAITADMFHYGHLKVLQEANDLADFHICGVLTDEAIKAYKGEPVASFRERAAIVSNLRCIDMVMKQDSLDPTDNLKKLHSQFPKANITVIYGSNWKKVPGEKYIKKIKGKIFQPKFYDKLSTEKIIKKISKTYSKTGKKTKESGKR